MEFFEQSSSDSLAKSVSSIHKKLGEKPISEVPEELHKALLDFSIAFLVDKPKDVVDYAVDYFSNIQDKRTNWRRTMVTTTLYRSGYGDEDHLEMDEGRRSYIRTSAVNPNFPKVVKNGSYRSFSEERPSMSRKSTDRRVSIRAFTHRSQTSDDFLVETRYSGDSSRKSADSNRSRETGRKNRDLSRRSKDSFGKSRDSLTRSIDRNFSWHRGSDKKWASKRSNFWYEESTTPRRKSIFAESFDPDAIEEEEMLPVLVKKPPELRRRLRHSIKNVLIFQTLDPQQFRLLLDAMTKVIVRAGEVITVQGTPATDLFVIDRGIYKVYRDKEHVYTFTDRGVFGELAMISTKMRLATIVAETEGALWTIDRHTFRKILLTKAYNKRHYYEEELQKIDWLQVLTKFELMNLADALQEKTYKQGEYIFRAGDKPDGMYLVVQGIVQIKAKDRNGVMKNVRKIGEAENFFGELSLTMTHSKRIASAVALSHIVHVAFLSFESFKRILGDSAKIIYKSIELSHPHYAELIKLYESLNIDVKHL